MVQKPEKLARAELDELLTAAAWIVADASQVNITAGWGVAIREALASNRLRSLIQMVTCPGKTFTAISFICGLIKFAGAAQKQC